jgi:hypothetical protein
MTHWSNSTLLLTNRQESELNKAVLWIRTGFNADPDPAFYLNVDPDPGSQTNADPDPALVRL